MPGIEVKEVWHGVFRIKELFYKEHANLYLLIGDEKDLLIDTGIGVFDIKNEISKISKKPLMALNTHCHFDHSGGNKFFPEIFIHASERKCLANPEKNNTASFLLKDGDFVLKNPGLDIVKYKVESPKMINTLKNNQAIKIGSFNLKVLHTPGHSAGSICLYEPDKKILFSGDVIYDGQLLYDLPFSDTKAYLNSLKELSKLNIDMCFPGHNEILDKAKLRTILKNAINTIETALKK